MKITEAGREDYLRQREELEQRLVKVRENKASAYIQTGDTWHDNPYFKMVEQEEGQLIKKINSINRLLRESEIVETLERNTETVEIGSIVKVESNYDGEIEEETFEIVGHGEGSIEENKISYESPVAKALLGHGIGEEVICTLPQGSAKYKILKMYNDWGELN